MSTTHEQTLGNCLYYQSRARKHAADAMAAFQRARSNRTLKYAAVCQEAARINSENAFIRLSRLIGVE